MRRVVFVNRFYWPETPATGQLLTDLAEGLAAHGWEVSVVTSGANPSTPHRETHRGVAINRVAGTRWARRGPLGKAMDFATFYAGALWQTLRSTRAGTIIVPLTDPPLLGVGVWFAARVRHGRVVHWIQDIYPEVAILLLGQSWLRLVRPLRNLAWRRAKACVTLGTDMARALTLAGVSPQATAIIPNWAPAGLSAPPRDAANPLREAWGLTGRFVVAYSGNLGRVHDLEPIIALADALRTEPAVAFLIVGEGAQLRALESAAQARALPNLHFHPTQPRHRLGEALAVGDLHLVTLRPGCEWAVFPSKLYGIAAIGRPILFIGPPNCEVARCVTGNRLGRAAARDDISGLAALIRQFASDRRAYDHHVAACLQFTTAHAAEVAIERWHQLLLSVVAEA